MCRPVVDIRQVLEAAPDGIDTRAIALHVIEAKGLDTSDRHLRKAIAYELVQVLRRQENRGEVVRAGKRQGAADLAERTGLGALALIIVVRSCPIALLLQCVLHALPVGFRLIR